MAGTFELRVQPASSSCGTRKAGNHEVILTSELYKTKAAAQNGIESVRSNAGNDAQFDRKTARTAVLLHAEGRQRPGHWQERDVQERSGPRKKASSPSRPTPPTPPSKTSVSSVLEKQPRTPRWGARGASFGT